jgi:hypothetical protein
MEEVLAADALRVLGENVYLQNFWSAGRKAPIPLSASVPASALVSAPHQKRAGERGTDIFEFFSRM